MKTLASFQINAMQLQYRLCEDSNLVQMEIIPAGMESRIPERRSNHRKNPWIDRLPPRMADRPALKPVSLAQVHSRGAAAQPNDPALSLLNSATSCKLIYQEQKQTRQNGADVIQTILQGPHGLEVRHFVRAPREKHYVETWTEAQNKGSASLNLEHLSSFCLAGLSPFDTADSQERLRVHRFRSFWSREARLLSQDIEELHLSLPWICASFASEHFGHVGSWPCHGWFPFLAIEDTREGVMWGAQLAHPGSWQMQIHRQDDGITMAGGLADYHHGHWAKNLEPGETLKSPLACIACCQGDLDELCAHMLEWQEDNLTIHGEEADLPVQVNDFLQHWGATGHEPTLQTLEKIASSPVRYLVIDAGWYKPPSGDWSNAQGDWMPSKDSFPAGIQATSRAIRKAGLIPGIWFEMEVACKESAAYAETNHQLKRNGQVIEVGDRRFWDFRDPWVVEYLSEKLILFLQQNDFGYLKVDYNASVGIGVDGAESLGEGLRQHLQGVQKFFRRIQEALPDLVIENCASGGMRLEPSMMALASLGSYSDCHETVEGPIIAANLHRLILPRQSLVWASLRKEQSEREMLYVLSGCFLGRMCLSGDLITLSDTQWQTALRAMQFYREMRHIIKKGKSHRFGPPVRNYRTPRGWQAILRVARDGKEALLVAHAFQGCGETPVTFSLPRSAAGLQIIQKEMAPDATSLRIEASGKVHWRPAQDFSSVVAHLTLHEGY